MGNIFASNTVTITASSVAWYGAIVATISALLGGYNVIRDRAKVKVWYSWNNFLVGDPRKEGKDYLRVDVINTGRRPVKITHVGAKMHGTSQMVLFNASFHKDNEDKILTEQNPVTSYLTEQDGLDRHKLWYIYAIEARGKEYRVYPSFYDRLGFWAHIPKQKLDKSIRIWKKK